MGGGEILERCQIDPSNGTRLSRVVVTLDGKRLAPSHGEGAPPARRASPQERPTSLGCNAPASRVEHLFGPAPAWSLKPTTHAHNLRPFHPLGSRLYRVCSAA